MSELTVPGYQTLAIEQSTGGTYFVYMGTNFVALDLDQMARYFTMIRDALFGEDVTTEQLEAADGMFSGEDIFRPGRGS